jgi:hypothetical protein
VAVIVEFLLVGATPEQVYEAESAAQARSEASGAPPYPSLMFVAVTPAEQSEGFRFVSAWRTEADFRRELETLLGPDLAAVGLEASDVRVAPVLSMAMPGAGAG